ncbi:hypothetical protein [Streptomyces sp. NPDC050355]|uniref:hypothetical protein n=1 Tax=Streptomyces sp. NPDC050355 TaxID=3365609 RepID=UPI0037955FE2
MSRVADAAKAVAAAERRKLPVPDAVREAAATQAAVFGTAHRPDPERPALPDSARDTAAVIQAHAEALRLADVTRRAASLFSDEADQRYVRAVAEAVPAWIDGLKKEFAALVGVVRKAADKLPHQVDPTRLDWNNPTYTTAYNKAEGAVAQLEQLVSDRADICKVAGSDGGRDNALFAVAALPEPTADAVLEGAWQEHAQVVAGWRELRRQPVAQWVYLVRQDTLTLGLATPGRLRERAGVVQLWRDASFAGHSGQTRAHAKSLVAQVLAA